MSGIFKAVNVNPFRDRTMDSWKDIADAIVDTVKDAAGDFWETNQRAKDHITERAKRLAKLTWEYKTASDDATKAAKKEQMEVVKDTIETELLNIALIGEEQAKNTFVKIAKTVFSAVVKLAPALIAAV